MDAPSRTIETAGAAGPAGSTPIPTTPPEDVLTVLRSRQVQGALGILLAVVFALAVKQTLAKMRPVEADILPVRLDLNRAGLAELVVLPGLGPTLADRIVRHREEHGPFARLEDLGKVPGIGPKTLDLLRSHLEVSAAAVPVPMASAALPTPMKEVRPPAPVPPGKNLPAAHSIDLNRASLADLDRLPGIGPKLAQRIVEERARRLFAAVDDIVRVKGIGPKTLEKIRPYAVVGAGE